MFQLNRSGHWEDFIGIQTWLFLCVNAWIGIMLGYGAGRMVAARWGARAGILVLLYLSIE